MKRLFVFVIALVPSVLASQTTVEQLWRTLDSLNLVAVNNWKMSPDLGRGAALTGDPRQPGFDDSQWTDLTLNESF